MKEEKKMSCFTMRLLPALRKKFKVHCINLDKMMVERIRELINEDLKKK